MNARQNLAALELFPGKLERFYGPSKGWQPAGSIASGESTTDRIIAAVSEVVRKDLVEPGSFRIRYEGSRPSDYFDVFKGGTVVRR